MKKSLIALAALAAVGAASAQSSVTLFGIVDAAVAVGSGSLTDRTRLVNSGYNSSRLGFRGTEDLGGGMSASFWLEAGVNNDDGSLGNTNTNNQAAGAGTANALTFNRRSTVSLSGGFGELRLGRDYTPHFWNHTVYDPFGTNGVGTNQILNSSIGGITTVRASNSIGYFLPGNLGGFFGQAQYYMGENASGAATSKDGNGFSVRLGYAGGPVSVAVASGRTKLATGSISSSNLGGSFNMGIVKVSTEISRDRVANGSAGKGFLVGANVAVGAGEIRAALSQYNTDVVGPNDQRSRKLALGYVHNLSKRTAVYTTYARVANNSFASQALNGSTTALGGSSSGLDLGVRHSF